MTTHYAPTEQGGMRFISERRPGEVRIPNYVYDLWMPLIGSDAMGLYAVYCRLEREGAVKAITQHRLAQEMRIGIAKMKRLNELLIKCRFIKVRQPDGHEKLMHWTTEVAVLDPPREVSAELIKELAHPKGYEPLSAWLCTNEPQSQVPNGNAESTKEACAANCASDANVAPSVLHPLGVEEEPASPDSPPADDSWPEEIVALGEDDVAETEAMFNKTKPSRPRSKEQHKASVQRALESFGKNGGQRAGVADPMQDSSGWKDIRLVQAFAALAGQPVEEIKASSIQDWPGQFKEWAETWGDRAPTIDETVTCVCGIRESEHDWKTWTSPRQPSFQEVLDVMLSRHRAGKPWHKDGKRKEGGSSGPRKNGKGEPEADPELQAAYDRIFDEHGNRRPEYR